MILENTDANQIVDALSASSDTGIRSGGQVLTLIINTNVDDFEEALAHAQSTGAMHPARILVAVRGFDGSSRLDAEIQHAHNAEIVVLKFAGDVDVHASSVLLPLLLPNLPVFLWIPNPDVATTLGLENLTSRVIYDSTRASDPIGTLYSLAAHHQPQQTDLAWTRLTKWRAMLVAALDQIEAPVTGGRICAQANNSPAILLKAWLEERTQTTFDLTMECDSQGLHGVRIFTQAGEVSVHRISESQANFLVEGHPDRRVALARRTMTEQLSEELGRSQDDTLHEVMTYLARDH